MNVIREIFPRTICLMCIILVFLVSACRLPYRIDYTRWWHEQDSINKNLLPWTDKGTCQFGYKNNRGKWVVPGQFDYVESFYAWSNRAVVIKNHKFGLVDSSGHIYPGLIYDSILAQPLFDRSKQDKNHRSPYYFVFRERGKYGLLDTMGHVYLRAKFPEIRWIYGRLMEFPDRLCDTAGAVVLKGAVIDHGSFSRGAEVFYRNRDLNVYDNLMEVTYPRLWTADPRYEGSFREAARSFKYRRKSHKRTWVIGLIDSTGRVILPADFIKIQPASSLPVYIVTSYKDQLGMISFKGDTLISPVYFDIKDKFRGDNNLFYLEKDNLKYIYDYKARALLFGGHSCKPDDMMGNTLPVRIDGKYSLARMNGKMVTTPEYDDINRDPKRNKYVVKKNGKYGIIDTTGQTIVPCTFDNIALVNEYLSYGITNRVSYLVKDTGHYGIIDTLGKTIIPCRYDTIIFVNKEIQYLIKDGRYYGLMDSTGKVMLPCKYEEISAFYKNYNDTSPTPRYAYETLSYSIIKEGDNFGLVDSVFKIVIPPRYTFLTYRHAHCDTSWFTAIKDGKAMILTLKGTHLTERIMTGKGIQVVRQKRHYYHYEKLDNEEDEFKMNKRGPYISEIYLNRKSLPDREMYNFLVDKNGTVIKSLQGYFITSSLYGGKYYYFNFSDARVVNNAGLMDSVGNVLLNLKYGNIADHTPNEEISHLSDTLFYVTDRHGRLTVFDAHFQEKMHVKNQSLYHMPNGWLVCWTKQGFLYVSVNWKVLSADGKKTILRDVVPPCNFKDVYIISKHRKFAIADHDGHCLTGFCYDGITPAPYNHFLVRQKWKYGLIDMHGQIILPCKYSRIGEWRKGYSIVEDKELKGLLDSNGHFVVEPNLTTSLFQSTVSLPALLDPAPLPQGGQISFKKGVEMPFCSPYVKNPLDSAGIKTELYYYKAGYYSLLKAYPDNMMKNTLNNYIMVQLFPYLPIDATETQREHIASKDYYYYHENVEHNGSSGHGYYYNPALGICRHTEYSFEFVSPKITGIKKTFHYKPDPKFYQYTDTSSVTQINHCYFYHGADGVDSLPIGKVLMPGAWEDTLRQYIKAYFDKTTPEMPVCLTPQQKIQAENSIDRYLFSIQHLYTYEITRQGLAWDLDYYLPGTNGNATVKKFHVVLAYKDMKPYFIPGSPVEGYYKLLK